MYSRDSFSFALQILILFWFWLQPYAWEAREFLRKKLTGKEIQFYVEYKVPGSGKEYGCVYTKGPLGGLISVTEELVAEGLVEVRRGGMKPE